MVGHAGLAADDPQAEPGISRGAHRRCLHQRQLQQWRRIGPHQHQRLGRQQQLGGDRGGAGDVQLGGAHQQHRVVGQRRQRQIEGCAVARHRPVTERLEALIEQAIERRSDRRHGRARGVGVQQRGVGQIGRLTPPVGVAHPPAPGLVGHAGLAGGQAQHRPGLAQTEHGRGQRLQRWRRIGAHRHLQAGVQQLLLGSAPDTRAETLGGLHRHGAVLGQRRAQQVDVGQVADHRAAQHLAGDHQRVEHALLAAVHPHPHPIAMAAQPCIGRRNIGQRVVEQRQVGQRQGQAGVQADLDRRALRQQHRCLRAQARCGQQLGGQHAEGDVVGDRRGLEHQAVVATLGGHRRQWLALGVLQRSAVGPAQFVAHTGFGTVDGDVGAATVGHLDRPVDTAVGHDQVGQRESVAQAQRVDHPVARAAQRDLVTVGLGLRCLGQTEGLALGLTPQPRPARQRGAEARQRRGRQPLQPQHQMRGCLLAHAALHPLAQVGVIEAGVLRRQHQAELQ